MQKTKWKFKYGRKDIDIVKENKYLGCILEETLDFTVTANTLAAAAGRAVGALVNKGVKENNLSFKSFSKLYDTCVLPIITVRHPLYVVVPFRIVKMAAPANGKEVFAYFKAI